MQQDFTTQAEGKPYEHPAFIADAYQKLFEWAEAINAGMQQAGEPYSLKFTAFERRQNGNRMFIPVATPEDALAVALRCYQFPSYEIAFELAGASLRTINRTMTELHFSAELPDFYLYDSGGYASTQCGFLPHSDFGKVETFIKDIAAGKGKVGIADRPTEDLYPAAYLALFAKPAATPALK